ncbi:hypothetical protein HMPREF0476_0606 [Kingella kingae ATCC 23330]|uniref:Uncharacterized protein n=1 Tax=Kingella kingae ATCC 23330 TaxID=887327 RepID=F5S5X3_KINKI|nr:hypothetical protein HMPREF0476_0606 [Kingella kingae ATCC 23330]
MECLPTAYTFYTQINRFGQKVQAALDANSKQPAFFVILFSKLNQIITKIQSNLHKSTFA